MWRSLWGKHLHPSLLPPIRQVGKKEGPLVVVVDELVHLGVAIGDGVDVGGGGEEAAVVDVLRVEDGLRLRQVPLQLSEQRRAPCHHASSPIQGPP